MDRIVLMVIIAALFSATLWQAREIGKQGAVISIQAATMKHEKAMTAIKARHQSMLAENISEHQTEVDGLKNELIEQASTFEDMGLSDASGLGERESGWLNEFMQRNSRPIIPDHNGANDKNLPSSSSDKADKTEN